MLELLLAELMVVGEDALPEVVLEGDHADHNEEEEGAATEAEKRVWGYLTVRKCLLAGSAQMPSLCQVQGGVLNEY